MVPRTSSSAQPAIRHLHRRRGIRRAALILGFLAAFASSGEFFALCCLSARVARVEQACGLVANGTNVSSQPLPAESPACTSASTSQPPSLPPSPAVLTVGPWQSLCPELYASPLPPQMPADKTVYLTFDDGPSEYTQAILDILAQYHAKATWFLVGTQLGGREALVKGIADAGHTVALHSDSHCYAEIYASPSAFVLDLGRLSQKLYSLTGQRPELLRFAGGSVNHYNASCSTELCAEVLRRGLRYYDWNVSAQDAVAKSPNTDVIAGRVLNGITALRPGTPAIVLMHDTKATTPEALPQILETLSRQGYTFAALDSSVPMVAFSGGEMS